MKVVLAVTEPGKLIMQFSDASDRIVATMNMDATAAKDLAARLVFLANMSEPPKVDD
jgi:hypothetical protein